MLPTRLAAGQAAAAAWASVQRTGTEATSASRPGGRCSVLSDARRCSLSARWKRSERGENPPATGSVVPPMNPGENDSAAQPVLIVNGDSSSTVLPLHDVSVACV